MKSARERAVEAIDSMPESLQERFAELLEDQLEKYRKLKRLIDEGMADIEAGRVHEWNFDDFLRRARL
jgi:predicted transcriptional regulator